jgi:hypothetical protein
MSGFGTDEEEKIRMALAALPQTGQDNLQGLKFSRINGVDATDPDTGGDYDPDTHTITLYDPAFQTSLSRVGDSTAGISTMDVRAVVHEIGHVMDLYKFNDVYNQAAQMSSVSAGKKLLKAARSPSGHRWSQEKVPGEKEKKWMQVQITAKDAKTHDFRQAVKADGGKEVTNYAATDWMESYAESYSLFVTDPERLKALRPKVYEYFKIKFPN